MRKQTKSLSLAHGHEYGCNPTLTAGVSFESMSPTQQVRASIAGLWAGRWRITAQEQVGHQIRQVYHANGTARSNNVIYIAIALGLAACHEGRKVKFFTAAGLVTALTEARDDKVLLRFTKHLARQHLIIVDEFGYVPFSKTGAELLFEFSAQRYERGSVIVTTNLPFDQWTEVLGSERLTGALLDRLTHRVHILEMNGESCRFRESVRRLKKKTAGSTAPQPASTSPSPSAPLFPSPPLSEKQRPLGEKTRAQAEDKEQELSQESSTEES